MVAINRLTYKVLRYRSLRLQWSWGCCAAFAATAKLTNCSLIPVRILETTGGD